MIIIAGAGISALFITQEYDFIFYISNQTDEINPVQIRVYIDGEMMVNDSFYVENYHNWTRYSKSLSFRIHVIKVVRDKNFSQNTKVFLMHSKQWAVIDFWHEQARCEKKNFFTIDMMNTQPKFYSIPKSSLSTLQCSLTFLNDSNMINNNLDTLYFDKSAISKILHSLQTPPARPTFHSS